MNEKNRTRASDAFWKERLRAGTLSDEELAQECEGTKQILFEAHRRLAQFFAEVEATHGPAKAAQLRAEYLADSRDQDELLESLRLRSAHVAAEPKDKM
jgi:hypothetical protein